MVIIRGEIWWASLPPAIDSEPGYQRPVLVIQDDAFNQSLINTVIVVVISSNLKLAEAPGNVLLPKNTGLSKESVANVSQIITVDKSFLSSKISSLTQELMELVDKGLRMVLYL